MRPADELRAAATLLRETESRTLGNGRPWRYAPGKPSDSVRTESGWEIAYGDDPSNLRWIALASPALAEPLAAQLDAIADFVAVTFGSKFAEHENGDRCGDGVCRFIHAALTSARLINGSTS